MMVSTSADSTKTALCSPTVVVEPVSVHKRQETFSLEAEANSTEYMRENVKHFSIDDSYIFGSSENTSTTSSGEVVLRANKPL